MADNNSKSCTDFNDLHREAGLSAVKAQLLAALAAGNYVEPAANDVPDVAQPASESEAPPDYGDIPLSSYEADMPPASPVPSSSDERTLAYALRRFALAMPDAKVWDVDAKAVLKISALKLMLGAKLYKAWNESDDKRIVDLAAVRREAAAAEAKGGGGLAAALERWIYLYPSSTAWDTVSRRQVPLADLRSAIADCYDAWIKHPQRRDVPKENLVFDPTQSVSPDTHINLFRGLPLTPVDDLEKCKAIRTAFYRLCNGDQDVYFWVMKWLAYPLQHVGAKMATALVVHSNVHGSGKSFLFDGLMRVIYGEYHRVLGQAELESPYNDWISQVLFSVFEEVLSKAQRYSHTGTIKQMITGTKIRISQKYMQSWEESNRMNSVFLSNEIEPVPVEPHDRRMMVVWPEHKMLDKMQGEVAAELQNGGAEAFLGYLLTLPLGDFNEHTKPLMTEAKRRLIEIGLPGWQVFYDDWSSGRVKGLPHCCCRVLDLYRVYKLWAKPRNEHVMGMNRFSGYMATFMRRRQDVNFRMNGHEDKATFFMVGTCPADKNQEEWLGGCVAEFERYLRGSEGDEGQ